MITKKEIMVLGSGISGLGSVMLAKKMDIDVFLSEGNIIDEDTKKTLRNEHIDFEENGNAYYGNIIPTNDQETVEISAKVDH